MASLLPPGKIQFLDADGKPLAGGSVTFSLPGTTTPKATYQDAAATILNTNPVILDAAGEAIIYGLGTYRQVLQDAAGNEIWDQETGTIEDIAGDLNIEGAANVGGFLAVRGGLNVVSGGTGPALVSNFNTVNVSGDLSVNGASSLTTVTASGNLNVSGTIAAGGSLTVGTTFEVAGSANFDGPTSINSLSVLGPATIGGNFGATNITASATIGCATLSASGALSGSTSGWQLNPSGTASFSGAYSLGINSGAGVLGTTFIAASDARVKTEIENVPFLDACRFVRDMRARVFLKDGSPDAGFIAQDAIVHGFQRMVVVSDSDDPRMAVGDDVSPIGKRLNLNYNYATAYHHSLISYLMDVVEELQAQIDHLKN